MTTREAAAAVHVVVDDRQSDADVDLVHLEQLLRATLVDQGAHTPAEVGLAFVPADEMTGLNESHMAGAGPTDVLAFPIDGLGAAPVGQPALLGDIVICPAVAAAASSSLADELALLVVHGALHLLGHDHARPAETARMRAAEAEMLARHHASR